MLSQSVYWVRCLIMYLRQELESCAENTMAKKPTSQIARSAKTGQFIPMKVAKANPSTTVVETIKPRPSAKKK